MTKSKAEIIEKFYKDESNRVLFEINKIVCDEVLAEEIYHESIFRCIQDMNKWCGKENITAENIMNMCKSVVASEMLTHKILYSEICVYTDPLEIVICDEIIGDIVKEIDELRTYSSVLKLYLFENLSVREISALLNIKPDTVAKQIIRGKEKLCMRLKSSKSLQSLFL